jgi:hypothetical protein
MYAIFDVLKAVNTMTSCSAVDARRCFEETYLLHLQVEDENEARNQLEKRKSQNSNSHFLDLPFDPEYAGSMFLRNVGVFLPD